MGLSQTLLKLLLDPVQNFINSSTPAIWKTVSGIPILKLQQVFYIILTLSDAANSANSGFLSVTEYSSSDFHVDLEPWAANITPNTSPGEPS